MSEALRRDYHVCGELGWGRFGVVSRAQNDYGVFTIKSIHKRIILSGDSLDAQCLLTEPKILKLLDSHPNVINLHDLYEDGNYIHMVLDLCDAPDLYRRVRLRFFAESEASLIMTELMQSVAHCYLLGVAHRDIKLDNILFDGQDRLWIAHFGSAEMFGEGKSMISDVRTPYYIAPEVVAGREYREKVDIWCCSVVLYIMLAGFPPFYGESAGEIFEAVLSGNLRFPSRVFSFVSASVKNLLRRMLCKDVSRRFSAEQVLSKSSLLIFV